MNTNLLCVLVNLCSNNEDKLEVYRQYFEQTYIETTRSYYVTKASAYLELYDVKSYMCYVTLKLQEEEVRAEKYLDTSGCSVKLVLTIFTIKKPCVILI